MSKNKKNKKSKVMDFPYDSLETTRNNDGFMTLKPTNKGKKSLDTIKIRRSKISSMAALETKEDKPAYDPSAMSAMLDEIEDFVKAGKYGKALDAKKEDVLQEFLNAFSDCGQTTDLDKKLYGMAKKLITLGKSFYEYDEQQRELFDNISYDGLLAKYLKAGNQEPVGIIPKGLKNLQKTDITYPTLHNNVDKAYIIYKNDDVPKGVKETDSIEAFLARTYKELDLDINQDLRLELSPKIDGVSLNGTIHGDMITNPQTRGDKDESIKVLGLNGLQVADGFKAESDFGIQYEIFVTEEDRVKASEYLKLSRPYVSCRHAAAGIIHRLSTMEDDELLQFISAYPIATEGLEGTYEERMDYIQNFGIVPEDMPDRKIIKGSMDELLEKIIKNFRKLKEKRSELSFAIDGMVITVVDDDHQEALGRSGRTNKFQIAMKFNPADAISYVAGISLTTGKKGYRTIQVDLTDPVFIDGVRYDHVPVLSANLFDQMDLRVGSKVNVHRVSDVIPAISVVKAGSGKKLKVPELCPDCKNPLVIKDKKLYCDNPMCPGNIIGRFTGFFDAMGLDGYSDSAAEILYKDLNCKSLADILELKKEDFKNADVKSEALRKLPELLKDAISEHYDFEVLGSCGIPGIGKEKAKLILKECPFNKIHENTSSITKLMRIFCNFGKSSKMMLAMKTMQTSTMNRDLKTISKYVTRSGSTEMFRVGHTGGNLSAEVKKICRSMNFEITDGKKFDILITSDLNSDSEKMKLAREKNITIYDESSFIEYYQRDEEEEENED